MNKAELTVAVAEKTGLTRSDSESVITACLEMIGRELASGNRIQIPGFGSFEIKERPAHTGRNPATGETIQVPASKTPVFRPGKTLKDTVND